MVVEEKKDAPVGPGFESLPNDFNALSVASITQEQFIEACAQDNIAIVRPSFDWMTEDMHEKGFTKACRASALKVVDFLLTKGIFPWWSIHFPEACKRNDMPLIHVFLKHKPDAMNIGLQEACEHNHLDLVMMLIDQCNVQHWLGGFICACDGGHRHIAELMVKRSNQQDMRYLHSDETLTRARDCALRRGWADLARYWNDVINLGKEAKKRMLEPESKSPDVRNVRARLVAIQKEITALIATLDE